MAKKLERKGEFIEEQSADKIVYHFIDDVRKINLKCKEEYLKKNVIVHYPFDPKGEPKYGGIKTIEYQNLDDPLPRGIIKSVGFGYGFTKILSPILYSLDQNFNIEKVIVKPKVKFEIKNKVAYLGYEDLNRFYPKMDSLLKTHSNQKDALVRKFLSQYFPSKYKTTKTPYVKGTVYSVLSDGVTEKDLSKEDLDTMINFAFADLGNKDKQSKEVILQTREKIEKRFLEDAIKDYKKILALKLDSKNLEKKWEVLFKENSWIISNLFALPVFLFANQAYVGGKEIFNVNGKITDFLFKNSLTDNITIIEIKTHKTELLTKRPYRGKDVFPVTEELSGAINQVLDQRQNLMNDFHSLRSKTGQKEWFESLNSKCLIIAGSIDGLPEEGRKSFEMFRNNLHGIEIITFDEVLQKIEAFASLLKKSKKKK